MSKGKNVKMKLPKVTGNEKQTQLLGQLVENATMLRSELMKNVFDQRRDIDVECGYPKEITQEQYTTLYEREGIASRIVDVFPESCWVDDPVISENLEVEESEFETEWKLLVKRFNLYSIMERADKLSGVGQFGILLLGFNDGKQLNEEVSSTGELKLNYIRVFMQSVVEIKKIETDTTNERFGQPLIYTIQFSETDDNSTAGAVSVGSKDIHWSRIIHLADNREMSEVFGTPRLKKVYNRIYDLRKILSGSGEMFWKGAFPGFAFETNPDQVTGDIDGEEQARTIRAQFDAYQHGLQRYLAISGMSVRSLEVQSGDPTAHFETQMKAVAISIAIPLRVFMGSEQAKLASAQDTKAWNGRVKHRQEKYVGPYILRLFIDRLLVLGILPETEEYTIVWPDLNTPSDADKAEVIEKISLAFRHYVEGGVDSLIGPEQFMKIYMGLEEEEIEAIKKDILSDIENERETITDEETPTGNNN